MKRAIVVAASLVMVGCGIQRVHVEELHESYVTKSGTQEDALDAVHVVGTWRRGKMEVEMGLGYRIRDSGFYGTGPVFTARTKVDLWKK